MCGTPAGHGRHSSRLIRSETSSFATTALRQHYRRTNWHGMAWPSMHTMFAHHVPPLSPVMSQANDGRDRISTSKQSNVPGEVNQDSGRPRGYNGSPLEEHVLRSVGSTGLSLT